MTKKKILVVDDELNIIKSLSDLLAASGYEVITAMDGKAGIELAEKAKPDLILLDIMMPKISGLELLKKMKSKEKHAHVPIIIVSAKSDVDTLSEAMWNYADKYITKPYDPQDILKSIQSSLSSSLA
jgi:two-component system alkaline phosphatase synthesis response regulator PhoP